MQLISSVIAMRETSRSVHRSGGKIVLVPTMGAVHEGHLALVREAARHGDQVIVSIFVNPTQFGPKEDIQAYPRSAEEDWDKLEATALVHTVFAPSTREMYPTPDMLTWVQVNKISDHLCGGSREGHFRGVATVVTKLFNICHPDVAIFGLKDAQQFYLLRRLALDLNMDIELIGVPTVREPDGLALSSSGSGTYRLCRRRRFGELSTCRPSKLGTDSRCCSCSPVFEGASYRQRHC